MKRFLWLLICALALSSAQAQYTVMADDDGELQVPDKATFAAKNDLVPTSNLSVFIDTYRDGATGATAALSVYGQYWTDCELKILDKDGNIVYFFSTILYNSSQVRRHHLSVCDENAVVYYYVSGGQTNGPCVKPKRLFTARDSSIGATETADNGSSTPNDNQVRITAIQIYPSAEFRHLFLDPENSIMVWRQSPGAAEIDGKGDKLWRPAVVQFLR